MILVVLFIIAFSGVFPEGKSVEVTVRHDLGFERDTVQAIHWHKIEDKFYVLTKDSLELWVDNVRELR